MCAYKLNVLNFISFSKKIMFFFTISNINITFFSNTDGDGILDLDECSGPITPLLVE